MIGDASGRRVCKKGIGDRDGVYAEQVDPCTPVNALWMYKRTPLWTTCEPSLQVCSARSAGSGSALATRSKTSSTQWVLGAVLELFIQVACHTGSSWITAPAAHVHRLLRKLRTGFCMATRLSGLAGWACAMRWSAGWGASFLSE